MPGTLTARISAAPSARAMSWMTYSGSPFSSARGRLVSKSRSGCGSRAHRNAIADVSTGSFMLSLLPGLSSSGPIRRSVQYPLDGRLVPLYESEYPQHMADQERTQPEEAAAEALDALTTAYREAVATINAIPNPQRAFEYATQLANALRDTYQQASELRTQAAARIWQAEELSLAALAERIGVSKARADQLIRAARATKKEQQP